MANKFYPPLLNIPLLRAIYDSTGNFKNSGLHPEVSKAENLLSVTMFIPIHFQPNKRACV